ncbi:hypothetical protein BZA70DRAFT_293054 [Myxozyma melibiosi]|uniref:Uncharacterized protein n=1 Tax=Myxozyma melibiosi TaxID=54550 RepID=A0ABR1FD36_9ASCO
MIVQGSFVAMALAVNVLFLLALIYSVLGTPDGLPTDDLIRLSNPEVKQPVLPVTVTVIPEAITETVLATVVQVSTATVVTTAIVTPSAAADADDEEDVSPAAIAKARLKSKTYMPKQCDDPFRRPGYLQIPKEQSALLEARYVPYYDEILELPQVQDAVDREHAVHLFDDKPVEDAVMGTAPINWISMLKEHLFYIKVGRKNARAKTLERQLSWIRNRRILMAADSIDRFMAQHFCTALDHKFVIGPDGKHTTAWCTIPSLNFTIYHWHISSMFSNRPGWWAMDQMKRVSFEDRIENVYSRYIKDVNGMNGKTPDLILYQSNLWDVRGYAKSDEYKEGIETPNTYLRRQTTWSELKFFMNRQVQFIEYLRKFFSPDVPMMMRSVIPHRDQGKSDISLYEIDRMARFVAYNLGNEVFEWSHTVPGFPEIYRDDMHVNVSAQSTVYSDMLLYYLFRAVGGAQVRGKVTRWPSESTLSQAEAWEECHPYDFLTTR